MLCRGDSVLTVSNGEVEVDRAGYGGGSRQRAEVVPNLEAQ